MEYELTTDDGLRRVCQSVKIDEPTKAIVQRFDKVTREDFITDRYQRDLWDSNPICDAKQAPDVIVDEVIQDGDFLNWFYDHYNEIRKLKSQDRTEPLCNFADELLNRMKKYSTRSNNRPIFCIYRALAALFPKNFTCLASRDYLVYIADQMDIKVNKFNTSQVVKGHRRILDQFAKALGDPGDLDEVIQRMILPRELPDATSQEELDEESDLPSDEENAPNLKRLAKELFLDDSTLLEDINTMLEEKGQVINLSRLILQHTTFEADRGDVMATGFLVDMNKAFENFVVTALREKLQLSASQWKQGENIHLDTGDKVGLEPDLSWWNGEDCLFVGDAKYKQTSGDSGAKHSDIYQMLAYITALNLSDGLLIYAAGEDDEVVHEVCHVGKRIEVTTLDLSGKPKDILASVADIANRIKCLSLLPSSPSFNKPPEQSR